MSVDGITTASTFLDDVTTAMAGPDMTVPNRLHFINSAIIGPIFCFPGMIANILSILVWNRSSMRSSTGRYLTGQAIADFLLLFCFIVTDSAQAWDMTLGTRYSFGWFFSYIGYPVFFFSLVLSIWYTVGVTIDRYIMVCWITKAKTMCSEKRANFGLLLITVNGFLINLPHFFSFKPVESVNGSLAYTLTEFGGGPGGNFYEFWIHCIILILVPWVSVFFMNIKIIQKIRRSNRRMSTKKTSQSMKKSKESQDQITRILLMVTFSFLFFIGLQCVVQCLWMQKPAGASWYMISSSFAFAKIGIVFNSSLNFVFYCCTGKRFRNELRTMLGMEKEDSLASSLVNTPSTASTSNTGSSSTTGM